MGDEIRADKSDVIPVEVRADKSDVIPVEDYESDHYVLRKKCLVTFISHPAPMGSRKNEKQVKYIEEDECECLDDDDPSLDGDVDLDIYELHKFIKDLPQCKRPGMEPDFVLMRNHRMHEIDEKLQKMKATGHKYGSFIFVILTYVHTNRNEIQVYEKGVGVDHFLDSIKSFKSMAGKPKLFLIQADDLRMLHPTTMTKSGGFDPKVETRKIPTDADRIILMSTIPQELPNLGQKSKRHENEKAVAPGKKPRMSLLVQAFIEILDANRDTDLLCNTPLMLGRVDELVAGLRKDKILGSNYEGYEIPVPVITSTLTKKLFLYH